jgi:hypothetical protein
MTSPPLISTLAATFVRLKGGRLICWIMDLNPDEAIAAGCLKEFSLAAKCLQGAAQFSLQQATALVVLDRFMKDRIERRGVPGQKIAVIPPWPHETIVGYNAAGRGSFRAEHGLTEKFVVMYSGNHSPCHPLETLLTAAQALESWDHIRFCFVGGGSEFPKVREFARRRGLSNVLCLPYQPLDRLSDSLSAADLHTVILGEPFVGIVHPCKIYNILSVGKPVLYIGPSQSHVVDLLPPRSVGDWAYLAEHGDVDSVIAHIRTASQKVGHAHETITLNPDLSQSRLLTELCRVVEAPATERFEQRSPAMTRDEADARPRQ